MSKLMASFGSVHADFTLKQNEKTLRLNTEFELTMHTLWGLEGRTLVICVCNFL